MSLPSLIPNILYFQVIPRYHAKGNQSSHQGYSLMIDSVFADVAALSHYGPHHAHQSVISTYINPIREDVIAVDYPLPSTWSLDSFIKQQQPGHVRHFVAIKPKDENSASFNAAHAKLNQLDTQVPGIISLTVGKQPSHLYDGWVDRSKGLTHVTEMVFTDSSTLDEYDHHPAHESVAREFSPLVENVFMYDYECKQIPQ